MNQWNHSPNIIVIRYPPLAGGKFVRTCLSYFKSFYYPFPIKQISPFIVNLSNKDLKLHTHFYAMESVPDKTSRHLWHFYELKVPEFWGFRLNQITKFNHWDTLKINIEDSYLLIPDRTKDILKNYMCFLQIHDSTYEEVSSIVPNAKIVNLTDYKLIQTFSSKFKEHHINSGSDLNNFEGPNVINFSMKIILQKSKFLDSLSKLAFELSGDNTYDPRLEEYYTKYRDIHL